MMQYNLAMGNYSEVLRDVQEFLDNGWKLQGGVSVTCFKDEYDDIEYRYAQAVVKDDAETEDNH